MIYLRVWYQSIHEYRNYSHVYEFGPSLQIFQFESFKTGPSNLHYIRKCKNFVAKKNMNHFSGTLMLFLFPYRHASLAVPGSLLATFESVFTAFKWSPEFENWTRMLTKQGNTKNSPDRESSVLCPEQEYTIFRTLNKHHTGWFFYVSVIGQSLVSFKRYLNQFSISQPISFFNLPPV